MTIQNILDQLEVWKDNCYYLNAKIYDEENPDFYISSLVYNKNDDKFYIRFKERIIE